MLKSLLMLASEGAIRDGETNVISIFNIFEEFKQPTFPFLVPKITIFNMIDRQNEDSSMADCFVKVILDGVELHSVPIKLNFIDKYRTRSILVIGGFVVPKPGKLLFNFVFQDTILGSYSIDVINTGQPLVKTQ